MIGSGEYAPNDPYNVIKHCPHCQEIWIRVVGCPNVTCGSRPTGILDWYENYNLFKYSFKIIGRKVKFEKRKINKIKPQ